MKLILYMLKKFASIFLGALLFFVLILEMVNLFQNLYSYISRGIALSQLGMISFYYLPRCVWYAVPMSMLFATAYMLSDFYAKNELVAIFASGVSLFRFTLPLLIISIFMSFGLFLFEDNVVIKSEVKFNDLQNKVLQREKSLNNENVVIISDNGNVIYKAAFFDYSLERLYNLYVVFRDEDKNLDGVLFAESASWNKDSECWSISNGTMYSFVNEELKSSNVTEDYVSRLKESPETFKNNTINVKEVSTKDARKYIEHLERAGVPCAEQKAEYYKKYAFPFVVFVVVFLAIGLSGKTRKNVLIVSLALCIGAVVLFYVTQMITMLMAKFGSIPPVMGEWFPVILFTFFSIVLLRYSRT